VQRCKLGCKGAREIAQGATEIERVRARLHGCRAPLQGEKLGCRGAGLSAKGKGVLEWKGCKFDKGAGLSARVQIGVHRCKVDCRGAKCLSARVQGYKLRCTDAI
jgi:hypothetical protein